MNLKYQIWLLLFITNTFYFVFFVYFSIRKNLKKNNLELGNQINILEKKIIFEKEQVVVSISTNIVQYVDEYKYIKLNNKHFIYLFKL